MWGPLDVMRHDEERWGLAYAVAAFGSWGLVPVFWKQLGSVPSGELLLHRVVWSALCFTLLLSWRGQFRDAARALVTPARRGWVVVSSLLIGANWFVFLYAVATERIVEASLGYFINPLVSVALGALVLGEQLSRARLGAVCLAVIGVGSMTWMAGALPWISVVLALTFGTYGLVRKMSPVNALMGSTIEMWLLGAPAMVALVWWWATGDDTWSAAGVPLRLGLVSTGIVTALPLLWFAEAARRLPLSTMGFVQYLSPTGQLLLGVWVYGEPFGRGRLVAFGLIWMACLVVLRDVFTQRRSSREV